MNFNVRFGEVYISNSGGSGETVLDIDDTLVINNGVLGVNTVDEVTASHRPITASAVQATVGNIEILLKLI